jgi:signal peptidase I
MNMKNVKSLILISFLIVSTPFIGFLFIFSDSLYIIKGNSMKPALSYGDFVYAVYAVEKDPSEINADEEGGDIVVIEGPQYYYAQGFDPIFWNYIENDTRIIHRVIDKKLVNGTW